MYKNIDKCRLCFSKKILPFFNLGKHQPSNSLKNKRNDKIPAIPLELTFCKTCKVVQLSATASPEMLFRKYVWVTGTSDGAKDYSHIFYSRLIKKTKNKKKLFICEIASNDGTFLQKFKKKGHEVLGVDPAKNIARVANKAGINTIPNFFDKKLSKEINQKLGKADVIFARNVIPHVESIHAIAEGINDLISKDGTVAIEFHYSKKILDELHYDSIYHEHLFYFSIKTLTNFFKNYKLFPFDFDSSQISGGSLVIYFSKQKKKISNKLLNLIKLKNKKKINNLKTWKKFSTDSNKHSQKLLSLIKKISKKNAIIGYGASARSSTLLNYSKINNHYLDFIIDKNSLKNNKFTAGTNIKIYLPRVVKNKIKNYKFCILLAWNFKEEVIKELKKMKFVGKVIIPLPKKTIIYEIKKT